MAIAPHVDFGWAALLERLDVFVGIVFAVGLVFEYCLRRAAQPPAPPPGRLWGAARPSPARRRRHAAEAHDDAAEGLLVCVAQSAGLNVREVRGGTLRYVPLSPDVRAGPHLLRGAALAMAHLLVELSGGGVVGDAPTSHYHCCYYE